VSGGGSDLDAILRLGAIDQKLLEVRRRRAQATSLSATQEARGVWVV
jgi:hypothetical protein